jgi:hypothetical protein
MRSAKIAKKARQASRTRKPRRTFSEDADEAPGLLEREPVEIEGETPADSNESIEPADEDDESVAPAFED